MRRFEIRRTNVSVANIGGGEIDDAVSWRVSTVCQFLLERCRACGEEGLMRIKCSSPRSSSSH